MYDFIQSRFNMLNILYIKVSWHRTTNCFKQPNNLDRNTEDVRKQSGKNIEDI